MDMDKKSRGAVDPYTLGFVIALLGSVLAITNGEDRQASHQSADMSGTDVVQVMQQKPGDG